MPNPPTRKLQHAIHHRHERQRSSLIACLHTAADADDDPNTLDTIDPRRHLAHRLSACCRAPRLMQDNATGQIIYVPGRCNCRICPLCGPIRAAELEHTIREHVEKIDSPRMLTLTLKSIDAPLEDQITRLRTCFREFRRQKAWKKHVAGGIAVVEVTYNKRDDTWHPHLHCLIEGTYWKQSEIADLWERTTGDSRIVDVRMIASRTAAAKYVSKYVAKAATLDGMPDRRITEKALAFSGLRVAQPFGCLHGAKTKAAKTPRPEGIRDLILVDMLQHEIDLGNTRAGRIMAAAKMAANERPAVKLHRHRFIADKIQRFCRPPAEQQPHRPTRPPPQKLWTEDAPSAMIPYMV